jgi:hypothetical protein
MSESFDCRQCGEAVDGRRGLLGYKVCMDCGESNARKIKHCVVPMPKSNYILVTDPSLLLGLNSSHKGAMR